MRRFAAWTAGVLVVLALVGLGGVGWYYSGEILTTERPGEPEYAVEVLAVTGRQITLESTEASRMPGAWGIDAPEAYAQVGRIVDSDESSVTRTLVPISGRVLPGDLVDIDGYAYPQDPDEAFDFRVEEVRIAADSEQLPAWQADASRERWAILVHGRAARRNECFRMLPILQAEDITGLCVTYRNDVDAYADPDGIYRQGDREWEDVAGAVQFAVDQGATDVVLVGYSMGGQITANLLRRSELADQVDAVIWDAPLLDWGPVIEAGAVDRGVPTWLVPIGMQASEWRAGVDYAQLNQITNADEFEVPILLFHGTRDETVPVSVGDRFAAARPDLVTYRRVPGAGHVDAWNTDRRGYTQAVRAFLDEHVPAGR